jgi:Zn-dependent membrane protease YugP
VRSVQRAAALTYVVGLLDRLGMFLVLVIVAEGLHSGLS